MIPKNNITYSHIEQCLKELSDSEFQQRVWLRGEGPEVSSYSEVVCQLFDDTGIGDQLDKKTDEFIFSQELDLIFRQLNLLFYTIDYKMPITDILSHSDWKKVRQLSSQALKLIQKTPT